MKSLFREDESWTPKANDIAKKFGAFVKKFILDNPNYKIRELEYIMRNELVGMSLCCLMERNSKPELEN